MKYSYPVRAQAGGAVLKQWYSIQAKAGGPAEIKIYDEIGMWGISARQFSEDLAALPAQGDY